MVWVGLWPCKACYNPVTSVCNFFGYGKHVPLLKVSINKVEQWFKWQTFFHAASVQNMDPRRLCILQRRPCLFRTVPILYHFFQFGITFDGMTMVFDRKNISVLLLFLVMGSSSLKSVPDLTTNRFVNVFSQGPTNVHELPIHNCTFENENGYLKEVCVINDHKYIKCSRSNSFYRLQMSSCAETVFTRACPNDIAFYQACGRRKCDNWLHAGGSDVSASMHNFGTEFTVCGEAVCRQNSSLFALKGKAGAAFAGSPNFWSFARCDGIVNCLNSVNGVSVDEYGCRDQDSSGFKCLFDEIPIRKSQVCDNVCDCTDCEEEAKCNNLTIGVFCISFHSKTRMYVRPKKICDRKRDCVSGIDEKICENYSETCQSSSLEYGNPNLSRRRVLTPWSKCSIPSLRSQILKVCSDYRDQMNCSFSAISPLVCDVNGYPTTISEHVICKDKIIPLCDDKLEKQCVDAGFECKIHKHRLCDGIPDCSNGRDEDEVFCHTMIHHPINCIRRWSYTKENSKIPRPWVLDGINDCVNNVDEDPDRWIKECGYGIKVHYSFVHSGFLNHSDNCAMTTQLKCPRRIERLSLDRLCLGEQNCDSEICRAARKEYQIMSLLPGEFSEGKSRRLFYCLPGLKDLERKNGVCLSTKLSYQKRLAGVDDIYVRLPEHYAKFQVDCRNLFGELYVYVACTDLCSGNTSCPLKPLAVVLSKTETMKCSNYPQDKVVLSLADDNVLGLAIKKSTSYYSKAVFACDDGQCISFDKVCNLEVDCRDQSDENTTKCSNNFRCVHSGEYIPISKKCDGEFDCYDFSDECNDECATHVVMFNHVGMFVAALAFGIISAILNSITFINGLREYHSLKTETAQVNKCFVLLITFSDFLQGIFLIMLSIGNKFFNESTCRTQFEWTTSTSCTVLGVISTFGSLLSLYSMTVLSIIRAKNIGSMLHKRDGISTKKKILLGVVVLVLLLLSALVATLPLFAFEDYFVQNVNYHGNLLFVGAPNKKKHMKIIYSYYGRVLSEGEFNLIMSWDSIRNLVKDMFVNGVVKDTMLGFYGSNGFCLFNYFVRKDVPYRWFSLTVLSTNFLCVFVIGACYMFVNIMARKSRSAVIKNKEAAKTNRKLQRKIAIIVSTDVLTWLPFIIVCIINYTELVNTARWYSIFCIFFLPINAIINPIGIYDETIFKWCMVIYKKIKATFHNILSKMKGTFCSNAVDVEEIEMDSFPPPTE